MLLAELGLPPAQYRRDADESGKIRVTIHFNTSPLDPKTSILDVWVPGDYCTDDATAEDTTAIKTITYLEAMTNTAVRDVNHAKLLRTQDRVNALQYQLNVAVRKTKMFARGWLLATRYMHQFSEQIRNAAAMNSSISNLPDIIENRSSRLERLLEKRRSS